MTYFRPVLIAAAFICAGAQAQTADSPAAKKSANILTYSEGAHRLPLVPIDGTKYAYETKFKAGPSVSFELQQQPVATDKWYRSIQLFDYPVEVTRLDLNGVSLEPRIIDRMNAFWRNRLSGAHSDLTPVSCSKRGAPAVANGPEPCEEIRLRFKAYFNDGTTFKNPETGRYGMQGACTIFVRVRERDASWWCHSDGSLELDSFQPEPAGN